MGLFPKMDIIPGLSLSDQNGCKQIILESNFKMHLEVNLKSQSPWVCSKRLGVSFIFFCPKCAQKQNSFFWEGGDLQKICILGMFYTRHKPNQTVLFQVQMET